MPDALDEDRRARADARSWLLGRFVCPASRLAELGGERRALSVVVDAELDAVPSTVESLEARGLRDGLAGEVYVEDAPLDEIAQRGLRAKIRCGGARVPPVDEVAAFVRGCRERGIVLKATAGLHHAYPTGEGEHGFLNLLAAAVFGDEEDALRAPHGSFALDDDAFRWGGRAAGADEIAHVRATLFHSIGSCSFFEPVAELADLGLLA